MGSVLTGHTPQDQGGPLGPPCPACGMFEGAVTPGHLCIPPEDADEWSVWAVSESGHVHRICSLGRFDLAERRADDLAHSIARNDHARVADGKPCSGIRAIVTGWDVWEISHERSDPIVRAAPNAMPIQRVILFAVSLLGGEITPER